jgi:lipoate-protein ligase B
MSRSLPRVRSCWLGRVPYRDAWDLQRSLVESVKAGTEPETLLLLEHPHVFTMGRRAELEHVLWDEAERGRRGVELVWVDRGGDVTYHGPGQLVGYPILDLDRHGGDLLTYLRTLEQSLIDYVARFHVNSSSVPGLTGVWVGDTKVAAIGVKLTGRVTSHGFALNLTTDLDYFSGIVPCGLDDKSVTSLERLAGLRISVADAALDYGRCFARAFEVELEPSGPELAIC